MLSESKTNFLLKLIFFSFHEFYWPRHFTITKYLFKGGPQSGQKRDSGSAKRSSSNDHRTTAALGQFGSQNAFRTPRSKSATRTPSSGRPPLSSIQFNSALRSPHTGKRSSVYGHHGQQKDTRYAKIFSKKVIKSMI